MFPLRAEPRRQRVDPLLRRLVFIMPHPSRKSEARKSEASKLHYNITVQGEAEEFAVQRVLWWGRCVDKGFLDRCRPCVCLHQKPFLPAA